MLGRYVTSNARRNRPIAASRKISAVLPSPTGREKPSVNSEDPDRSNAARQPASSVAQKIRVKPVSASVSQVARAAIRASGP